MAGGVPAGRLSIEIVAEIARLQQDLDKAKKAVAAASGDIAKSARAANDNLAGMGAGLNKAGGGAKLAGHHMANLSFQIQDVIVGLQGGQKPMTVFLQQGSQIAQIAAQSGVGFLGMAKAIGAMAASVIAAHPVLAILATVAGVAAIAFGDFRSNVNAEASAELEAYAKSLGLTEKEIAKAGGAAVTSGDMLSALLEIFGEFLGVEKIFSDLKGWIVDNVRAAVLDAKKNVGELYAAIAATVDAVKAVWGNIGPILGEAVIAGANIAIGAVEWLINNAITALNNLMLAANPILLLAKQAGFKVGMGHIELPRLQNIYAGAGAKAADAFSAAYQRRLNESNAAFDAFDKDWARRSVDNAKDRLEAGGDDAGKKLGKAAKKAAEKEVDDFFKNFGKELTKAVKELTDKFAKETADDVEKMLAKISEQSSRRTDAWTREAEAVADYNDELYRLGDALSRLSGIGGGLGAFIGVLEGLRTGTSSGLSGPGGFLLDELFKVQFRDLEGDNKLTRLGDIFDEALQDVFGPNGSFKEIMQGAGMGIAGGQLFLGNQSSTGQLGSAIGGILGKEAGAAIGEGIKGLAGKLAGPIGGILGGVLGGLVGGMFKKTKKASATISGSGINVTGNSSSREAAAGQLAGSVTDAINEIAEALGADIDMALGNVSVGIRKKSLRIDPTGQGRTKGAGVLDFGQDQEAALKAAIADLISDGVLKGISAGMEKLLKGGDIEKQLEKALKFKGVFDELEQRTDPLAYDMKQLGREFDELSAIFAEAGATTEEYAQLEQLRQLRIKEIQEQYASEADALELLNEKRQLEAEIMRLQGNATGALTILRQLELEAMDATLRPLQEQIYALQDAAAKRELEIQLMEALGLAQEAEAARRAEYLKTIPDSLHALQQQIWAAQDATKATEAYSTALSDARSQLTAAYNREASALQQTADRFRGFADSLRDFRNSLYGADSGMATLRSMTVALMKTGGLAAAGNADAMAALPGVGRDYLSVAKGSAATAQDYARSVALVAGYTDKAIASASSKASSAEAQIAILTKQYEKLAGIEEEQLSFNEAMQRVRELLENPVVPLEPTPVALQEDYVSASNDQQQAQLDALNNINRDQNRRLDEQSMQIERLVRANEGMATNIAGMSAVIKRVERQGRFATVEEA